MMSIVIKIVINAIALWVATALVSGLTLGGGTFAQKVFTLVVVAVIFGLANTVIKPVVKLLALPAYILTLGLVTFVINAFMLWLTGWVCEQIGVAFHVGTFLWSAVFGALIISIVSFVLHVVTPEPD
ncbi:MAG: phage holin family protein [Streptosporangiaceae bacterium]